MCLLHSSDIHLEKSRIEVHPLNDVNAVGEKDVDSFEEKKSSFVS